MSAKRRPNGRDNLVASAALETLKTHASGEAAMAALASLVQGKATWTSDRPRAIRLIDLERRARFARPLVDFA